MIVLGSLIWGLKRQVKIQSDTLKVMEKRLIETEKLGEIYKLFLDDLPDAMGKFKEINNMINRTKDEAIAQLENEKNLKDSELEVYKQEDMKRIETQEKLISRLTEMQKIVEAISEKAKQPSPSRQDALFKMIGEGAIGALRKEAESNKE